LVFGYLEKGLKYLVRYFYDCKAKEEYFYEEELKIATAKKA
jgi:hypothetical protein